MAGKSISIVGGPAPYREALSAKIGDAGLIVGEFDCDVLVVCCTSEALWAQAADTAMWAPTVVVVPDLDIDAYVRALALGAGAVHLDTPTDVILDVVTAAIAGEALLPLAVTQALASYQPPTSQDVANIELEGIELQIAEGLLADRTIKQIAADLSYSDRTIRRRLQGVYLKLGVTGRAEAEKLLRSRADR